MKGDVGLPKECCEVDNVRNHSADLVSIPSVIPLFLDIRGNVLEEGDGDGEASYRAVRRPKLPAALLALLVRLDPWDDDCE